MSNKTLSIEIEGGLGNQLFQFAFGFSLASSSGAKLVLNTEAYKTCTLREFEISQIVDDSWFEIETESSKLASLYKRICYKLSQELSMPVCGYYKEKYLKFDSSACLALNSFKDKLNYRGFWQSEKYFSSNGNDLINIIDFDKVIDEKVLNLLTRIKSSESVAMHVRRGDYANSPETMAYHGNGGGIEYYKRAVEYFITSCRDVNFFVFSDDVEWCKRNISHLSNKIIFMDSKLNHFQDMFLMSSCDHNIIANSSFSWWAAYLNKNIDKKVVSPKKWFNVDVEHDIIPDDWVKL